MAVQIPKFKTKDMPPFIPYNGNDLETLAIGTDQEAYGLSDADYAKRHPELVSANNSFQKTVNSLAGGSGGDATAIQNQFMTAGLGSALGSMGDVSTIGGTGGGALTQGSAGQAALARSLGNNVVNYEQTKLNETEGALSVADQLDPHRQIGLSGQDEALVSMLNTQGQNNWNQADWAAKVQEDELNWRARIDNLNAQQEQANASAAAGASQTGSLASSGASIAGAAVMALALSCFVARAAYGLHNPSWRIFRRWLLTRAPVAFVNLYRRRGEQWAEWMTRKGAMPLVRAVMDCIVIPQRRRWNVR